LQDFPAFAGSLSSRGLPQKHDDFIPYFFLFHIHITPKEITGFCGFLSA